MSPASHFALLFPSSLRALSIADNWDETKEGIVPRSHYVLVLAAP